MRTGYREIVDPYGGVRHQLHFCSSAAAKMMDGSRVKAHELLRPSVYASSRMHQVSATVSGGKIII